MIKTKYVLFVLFILCFSKVLHASESSVALQFFNRDYTMFMLAETKIVSIKNFLDFLTLGPFANEASKNGGKYDALIELKKIELKHAVIEELELAGRYVFEHARLSKKKRKWKKMSLNSLVMERDLVIAPFKDMWEEHLRDQKTKVEAQAAMAKNKNVLYIILFAFLFIIAIFLFTSGTRFD